MLIHGVVLTARRSECEIECIQVRHIQVARINRDLFADIEDSSGTIQAWATLDRLGEQGRGVLADAHVGDIIGVRGTVVRTRRGEVSVAADAVEMLAKSLRPPPDRPDRSRGEARDRPISGPGKKNT